MNLRSCISEVNQRLGHVTKALGLRHKLESEDGEYQLFFERKDKAGVTWRSPISFAFRRAEGSKSAGWEISIGLHSSGISEVGTTGWVAYSGGWEFGREELTDAWRDLAYEQAEKGLRKFPLLPEEFSLPKVVDSAYLAEFWNYLKPLCYPHGIAYVDVGREEAGNEFYEFEYHDAEFRLLWGWPSVEIFKDGVSQDVLPAESYYDVEAMLLVLFEEVDQLLADRDGNGHDLG